MESEWRLNIAEYGAIGALDPVFNPTSKTSLVARLITPIPLGGAVARWVVQRKGPLGVRGTLGLASLPTPNWLEGQFLNLTGTFPYGYAVHPDN